MWRSTRSSKIIHSVGGSLEHNGVYVDLVSGNCPCCGQVLVNLKLTADDDPCREEDYWTSLTNIIQGTRPAP